MKHKYYLIYCILAGGYGLGDGLDQLQFPVGITIDNNDDSMYISDQYNSRVMKWLLGVESGIIVTGGNGLGNESNMLNTASQILLGKRDGSLLIFGQVNQRCATLSKKFD